MENLLLLYSILRITKDVYNLSDRTPFNVLVLNNTNLIADNFYIWFFSKYQFNQLHVFTVFRLLTDFVCLYNYEFWLFLCKIVRSSVILLLLLLKYFYLLNFTTIAFLFILWPNFVFKKIFINILFVSQLFMKFTYKPHTSPLDMDVQGFATYKYYLTSSLFNM